MSFIYSHNLEEDYLSCVTSAKNDYEEIYHNCMDMRYPYGTCRCNDNYYLDPASSKCQKCDGSCKTCHGPRPSDCIECYEGYGAPVDAYSGQCGCSKVG
jgi:hypothetical protein